MAKLTPFERIRKSLFFSGLATFSLVILIASSAFPRDCACCGSEVIRACQMDKAANSVDCGPKAIVVASAEKSSLCQSDVEPVKKSCCSLEESQSETIDPVVPVAPIESHNCSDCQISQSFCAALPAFSDITISKTPVKTLCLPCDECPLTFHAVDPTDLNKSLVSNLNCPQLSACPTPNSGLGCCQLTI